MTAASSTSDKAAQPTVVLSRRKKGAYSLIILFSLVLLVETLVRIGFFIGDRFSTYYLTFGFVPDIESHSAEYQGYTKFQPNSTYHYKPTRDITLDMRINGDGFRSKREFVRPKPPGTFRLVALGESSTFGLANDDDHTYPALLERRLAARLPVQAIEVFNLGIPHYRSNNILAMARAELAELQPAVVTLYAGYNNAMVLPSSSNPGLPYRAKDWLKAHSVTYRALHPYLVTAYSKLTRLLKEDVVGLPHLGVPVDLPQARVAQLRASAREEYRRDLDSIIAVIRAAGATPVLMTQTMTLARLPGARFETYRPYLLEVAYVESVLTARGSVPAPYSTLLIHHDIVAEYRDAARRHNVPLVEGLATLDRERERVMASFVHLTDEGNNRLSAAIESTLIQASLLPGIPPAAMARAAAPPATAPALRPKRRAART